MGGRAESLVLGATGAVVIAFVVSFATGVSRGGDSAQPSEPSVLHEAVPEPITNNGGRVEVLNASRRGGAARRATEQLRAAGFDVVYFGNAGRSAGDSSVVIDRVGNDAVARAVAAELGISAVVTRRDTTLFVDATVILGGDWTTAKYP
jgi:hypothetical protein